MKPNKTRKKPALKSRLNQRMSMRAIMTLSAGMFMLTTAIVLVVVNSVNPFSSHAQSDNSIEVVRVSDQVFTNETTLDNPEILQHKINGEHTILVREKKNINAQ